MKNYDLVIVGGGPAGIFAALEIMKLKPEWKVVLVEKGVQIEKRKCLLREGFDKCPTCKKCGLLCGWGGAGALVPITGFANAVSSQAIDSKSEGFVLGVGAKMFSIAGPVIVYALLSGAVYGVIYYIYTIFAGGSV